ncbi:MAG: DUF1761 domain-containing protein [Gemmatimonadota bacterium]|nr:DUF1761 domain-containing protein [Gemmatimonadota bacterium]
MNAAIGFIIAMLAFGLAAVGLRAAWYSRPAFRVLWSRVNPAIDQVGDQVLTRSWRLHTAVGILHIVMALVLTVLASTLGTQTAAAGARLGSLLWLGFVFPTVLAASLFSGRTVTAFLIDVLFPLVYLVCIGALVGALL